MATSPRNRKLLATSGRAAEFRKMSLKLGSLWGAMAWKFTKRSRSRPLGTVAGFSLRRTKQPGLKSDYRFGRESASSEATQNFAHFGKICQKFSFAASALPIFSGVEGAQ